MRFLSCFVSLCSLIGPASCALASDQIPGAVQTKPIAIVDAMIHRVVGDVIPRGSIVFEHGKITQIGDNLNLPADCVIIRGEGKHVYPSLIDAYSDLGLVEVNSVPATIDSSETGNLNPNVRAVAAFNPDSELIPVNRANGVLLAVTAPSGGLLAGRSAMMMLDGWTWEDMTLQADVGMHIRWPRRESDVKELANLFDQAKRYAAEKAVNENLTRDLRLDALAPVLSGHLPIIVDATSVEHIEAAVVFANQLSLRLIIHGGYDAAKCAVLLQQQKIPVIVSGVYRNPSRRHDPYDESYLLPKQLSDAGIQFCISANGRFGASGLRNLPYNAATAVAYGLTEVQALHAITMSPAEILGVSDRVGCLRVGLDATLFLANADILETPTQVELAFIQGRQVDLDNRHQQLYRKYSAKYAIPDSK